MTSLDALIPALRAPAHALVALAGRAGVQPRVTSTFRSHAEQARLYRRFLAGQQRYPVAPPGSSAHEYGYAFDMITSAMDPTDLADLGTVWKSWGGVWGGEFGDPIHFEYPGFSKPQIQNVASALNPPDPTRRKVAEVADFILGFAPYIGEAELAGELLHLGFPESKVAQFLRSPYTYLYKLRHSQ